MTKVTAHPEPISGHLPGFRAHVALVTRETRPRNRKDYPVVSSPARRAASLTATVLLVVALTGCRDTPKRERCTQADLDQPTSSAMPASVEVKETRRINRERLDPLPPGLTPSVSAERAWDSLHSVRPPNGGGRDELLLGLFSGKDSATRGPAWVLFTSRLAQGINELERPPGVTPHPDTSPCHFVDVLTALNAQNGERFYGSTMVRRLT